VTRRNERDGGFTLTELLVVITLTGIIGLIVGTAVITGLRQQTKVQDRSNALADARTALQRVDRDVRSANPLVLACATQIEVKEVGTTTTTLTYSVIDQTSGRKQLVVDQAAPTGACGSAVTPTSRKVLVSDLVNTSTSPVFTFSPGTVTTSIQVQPTTLAQPVVLSDKGVELRNPS
jgi:prepilin-type N-terminal cleavage/methylation domain-containing protein